MQASGMALKKQDYTVRVPRSQRGGEIVEPLLREQWFVRMQPLAEPALQVDISAFLCELGSALPVLCACDSASIDAWHARQLYRFFSISTA